MKCGVTPLEFAEAAILPNPSAQDKAKVLVFYIWVCVNWRIKVFEGEDDYEPYRPPQEMGNDHDAFVAQVLKSYFWISYT